jgi:hypothetical protein
MPFNGTFLHIYQTCNFFYRKSLDVIQAANVPGVGRQLIEIKIDIFPFKLFKWVIHHRIAIVFGQFKGEFILFIPYKGKGGIPYGGICPVKEIAFGGIVLMNVPENF